VGADILAQFAGEVSRVNTSAVTTECLSWPYPDLGFAVVRTGTKTATHIHLATLDRGAALRTFGSRGVRLLLHSARGDGKIFAARVNEYGEILKRMRLQAPRTLELLSAIKSQPWCLGAKGCGALGADTILLLFEKGDSAMAAEFVQTLGLSWVTDQLSGGMEVKYEAD
jgi:hypothetical protein